MKILHFEGCSDDTFGEYNLTNDDYDNCASGKPIKWLVTAGGKSILVVGHYCPAPATGWVIGVGRVQDDDNEGMPAWPMRIEEGDRPYSPRLVIDVPDDVVIRHVKSTRAGE